MPNLELTILAGDRAGERFEPGHDIVIVGSASNADLTLLGDRISPEHCRLLVGPAAARIEDLESEHGTLVVRGAQEFNVGTAPGHALELLDGDVIRLGQAVAGGALLRVQIHEDEEPAHVVSVRPITSFSGQTSSDARNAELLKALVDVHSKLSATSDPDQALVVILDAALRLVPRATHATLILRADTASDALAANSGETGVDAASQSVPYVPVLTRVRNQQGNADAPRDKVVATRSVVRKVIRERAAVLAADAPSEAFSSESLLGANIKSTIGVPLWRNDVILGVLQVDNRDRPALFDTTDLEVLEILTTNASLTIDNARLIQRLSLAEHRLKQENLYLKTRARSARSPAEIIGSSPALTEVMRQLEKAADTRVTILIEGETGTGKELIAAAVHSHSRRSQNLFVAQNCAAVPKDLLESELFGHKRGAFTGASEDKRGLFEIADGGTLFLDELAELPLTLQAKLLRVLQEREIRPLGALKSKRVDVRIVAACNKDLEQEVRAGRFREDLYYRLNVFPLKVPPLRERRTDIPLLCHHFLKRYTAEYTTAVLGFTEQALACLTQYSWPGNVRELENEIQRLVIQSEPNTYVPLSLLSDRIRGTTAPGAPVHYKGTLKQTLEQLERQLVSDALRRHDNNKTQAAKSLGITREGLHKKLKQLGVD